MRTQAEKATAFRALHERDGAFIIPNPWDAGTARLLARIGFEALATTSAGYAFSIGQRDNSVGRDRGGGGRGRSAVNVVMGLQGVQLGLGDLAELGVKRVSVGSALCRAVLGAFLRASREMLEQGTFSFAEDAVSFPDVSAMFEPAS